MRTCLTPLAVAVLAWSMSNACADQATVALANKSWLAFRCSYYANAMTGGGEEVKRLREVGYSAGKKYLEAADAGRLKDSELLDIPKEFIYPGPSHDYILGALSVFAMDLEGAQSHLDDLPGWAETEYRKRNCQHI